MKTFLRRPGNKTRHLKHVIPMIPEFTGTYYEPFLGTGAVYLHLLPKKAVLNDLNKDIMNIWKLTKKNPEYMVEEIDKFKKEFLPKSNEMKLKHCRDILKKIYTYKGDYKTVIYLLMVYCSFNASIVSDTNPIRGLYCNIYSKNQCHIFTENYKTKLLELKRVLKNIKLENKDYSKVLETAKEGDFVFLDPPYIEEKTYSFNYNENESFDIQKLKDHLDILNEKKVKWMMTQIDTEDVRILFKKYNFVEYSNNSNFNKKYKTTKKELMITNY